MGKKLPMTSVSDIYNIPQVPSKLVTDTYGYSTEGITISDTIFDYKTNQDISLPGYTLVRVMTTNTFQSGINTPCPSGNVMPLPPTVVVATAGQLIGTDLGPIVKDTAGEITYLSVDHKILQSSIGWGAWDQFGTYECYTTPLKSTWPPKKFQFKSAAKHSTKLGSDDPATFYNVSVFGKDFLDSLGDLSEYDDPYKSLSPIYGYQSTPYQPLIPYIHEERLKLEQQGKTPREIYNYFRDNDFEWDYNKVFWYQFNYINVLHKRYVYYYYFLLPETVLENTYILTTLGPTTVNGTKYRFSGYLIPAQYKTRTQSTLVVN